MQDKQGNVVETLNNSPALLEKVKAEAKHLFESGEAADVKEALVGAIKNILDVELSEEDLKLFDTKNRELSLEELEQVSGGGDFFDALVMFGADLYFMFSSSSEDPERS